MHKISPESKGEIVKFEELNLPQLEVWLADDTIWLTQKQMAIVFDCAPQNITYHLRQIFAIGELDEKATCKEFLQVQIEGGRSISRLVDYYNLDTIIYTLTPTLPEKRRRIGFGAQDDDPPTKPYGKLSKGGAV